jgi:hypothetical protein
MPGPLHKIFLVRLFLMVATSSTASAAALMKTLNVRAICLVLSFISCGLVNSAVLAYGEWSPPSGGVVRDSVAAVSIARAVWISMNPSLPKSSEELWQKTMDASLTGGVWHVRQKLLGKDYIGGGLVMNIEAKDGRITLIMVTQ